MRFKILKHERLTFFCSTFIDTFREGREVLEVVLAIPREPAPSIQDHSEADYLLQKTSFFNSCVKISIAVL